MMMLQIFILTKLLKHKIMNQTGYVSKGPKCFGATKRTSFVDIRDDDIPGPGSHEPNRLDKSTPTKWKFGSSTERDSFLQKYPRPYPAPSTYRPNVEPTLTSGPKYSIPQQQHQNPADYKQDDLCAVNYRPNSSFTKPYSSKYTFGYTQQMNYSTSVPPPDTYTPSHTMKDFNKTQKKFTTMERPLPYGQQGKFPGVGQYQVNSNDPMYATAHVFGQGDRPNIVLGPDAPGTYYNIGKQIKQTGKGYTMRPYYEQVKNKDVEKIPAPNYYNPKELESRKKIISFTGPRSDMHDKQLIKYPSPQKHVTSPQFYKKRKSLSFTQELRYTPKPDQNPGPGAYQVARNFNTTKGYMGMKIKDLPKFITPGADNYQPEDDLTKTTPQRVINYASGRSDFSKSITGQIGPGGYLIQRDTRKQLGKMSMSVKFGKNRNKNPGPGDYEIPGTIGSLPKYYCGPKKVTTTGFSTHALAMNDRTVRLKQKKEQRKNQQKQQQEVLRQQQEQKNQ